MCYVEENSRTGNEGVERAIGVRVRLSDSLLRKDAVKARCSLPNPAAEASLPFGNVSNATESTSVESTLT